MSLLKVSHLSYTYGQGTPFSYDAITDINFEIEQGEIVGIIGHTGSGKSTLVQHLNGLIKPSEGQIFLDGNNIWENPKKIRDIRFQVGLVFQYPEYQLFEETVYKDIAFGPSNMGLRENEIKERVLHSAAMVGLRDDLLQKSPFDLSGGEKRRAAIAGVMAMQPKIIVLDEPTAGLDPAGRDTILSRIKQYRDATGSTVLIVSHSMEDMAKTAERILVMNKGKVEMFDTVGNVFSHAELLESIGLNIPQVTQIALRLKDSGINVDNYIYTVEQMKNSLLKLMGRGQKNA